MLPQISPWLALYYLYYGSFDRRLRADDLYPKPFADSQIPRTSGLFLWRKRATPSTRTTEQGRQFRTQLRQGLLLQPQQTSASPSILPMSVPSSGTGWAESRGSTLSPSFSTTSHPCEVTSTALLCPKSQHPHCFKFGLSLFLTRTTPLLPLVSPTFTPSFTAR